MTTTYYVDTAGSDTNNGTSEATPWQTIAKVNALSKVAGTKIFFKAGQTFSGKITCLQSGAADNPITFGSYGTGRAIISSGTDKGIAVYNVGGVVVQDLDFRGVGRSSGNQVNGIEVYADQGNTTRYPKVQVLRNSVRGYGGHSGILIQGWPSDNTPSGWDGIVVDDNEVFNCSNNGIKIYPTNPDGVQTIKSHKDVFVRRNNVHDIPGIANYSAHSGSGIVCGGIENYTCEYNVTRNCGGVSTGGVGNWIWQVTNATMQFNESYLNNSSSNDGGGFDLDGGCQNVYFQYNYAHDNAAYGVLVMHYTPAQSHFNNVVRYNVFANNGTKRDMQIRLLGTFGTISSGQVYNNLCFASPMASNSNEGGISVENTTSYSVRNNIFITTGGVRLAEVVGTNTGLAMQGNLYWPSGSTFSILDGGTVYSSLAAWRTGKSRERLNNADVGLQGDPKVTIPAIPPTFDSTTPGALEAMTAYRLQSDSPAINAGLNLPTLFSLSVGTRDFFAGSIPVSFYDIGAHEYSGVALPPPLPDPVPGTPPTTPTTTGGGFEGGGGTTTHLRRRRRRRRWWHPGHITIGNVFVPRISQAQVSFDDPPGRLKPGLGLQQWRVRVRNLYEDNPTIRVDLLENGVVRDTPIPERPVTENDIVFEGSWDATVLQNYDGKAVEALLTSISDKGSTQVELASLQWQPALDTSAGNQLGVRWRVRTRVVANPLSVRWNTNV